MQFDVASSVAASGNWAGISFDDESSVHGHLYQQAPPSIVASGIIPSKWKDKEEISVKNIQRPVGQHSIAFDFAGAHKYLVNYNPSDKGWKDATFGGNYDAYGTVYGETMKIYCFQDQFTYEPLSKAWANRIIWKENERTVYKDKEDNLHSDCGKASDWSQAIQILINQGNFTRLALSPLSRYNDYNYCKVLKWGATHVDDLIDFRFPPLRIAHAQWRQLCCEIVCLGRLSLEYVVKNTRKSIIINKKDCRMQQNEDLATRVMSSHCELLERLNVCVFLLIMFVFYCINFCLLCM